MKHIIVILSLLFSGSLLAGEQTVVLSVPGMNCPVCPITVKKSIEKVAGVKSVNVSYESKSATVVFEDQLASIASIKEATENAGYPSEIIKGIK
ncbi:MAG: mercury resistance system periplasmic binding protein MerP [Mariprofundaceae bacterium]